MTQRYILQVIINQNLKQIIFNIMKYLLIFVLCVHELLNY